MTLPEQVASYPDCEELWALALADAEGAKARFPTRNKAMKFQMRMHKYRALLRSQSRRLYMRDDIRYDKSEFDELKVSIEQDGDHWWAVVTRHGAEILEMVPLSGETHVPDFGTDAPSYLPGNLPTSNGGRDMPRDRGDEPKLPPANDEPVAKGRRRGF